MRAKVKRRSPQRGVFSSIMWALVIDDLIPTLNNSGFYTQGYVYNPGILVTGKHEGTLVDLMQNALNFVEDWCNERTLSVNPEKTVLLVFRRHRNLPYLVSPLFYGKKFDFSASAKYLGVIFDHKLTWKLHVNAIV